jgi:hypothetical protein
MPRGQRELMCTKERIEERTEGAEVRVPEVHGKSGLRFGI